MLPKSAGDRVRFLDDRKAVHGEFEGRLPQSMCPFTICCLTLRRSGRHCTISQRAGTGADRVSEEEAVVKGFIAGFRPGRCCDLQLRALTDA